MINTTLKLVRRGHGLTQKELAVKLSMSKSCICKIEKGHKEINYRLLQKYARLFRTKVSVLIKMTEHLEDFEPWEKTEEECNRLVKVIQNKHREKHFKREEVK